MWLQDRCSSYWRRLPPNGPGAFRRTAAVAGSTARPFTGISWTPSGFTFWCCFLSGVDAFGGNSMADVNQKMIPMTEWGGGVLPYSIGHKKLGMWLFLLSD